ncbi:MAG: isoprenoid biosynthesis glyoxalase ElbB [Thermonemataceae bacterium]|nr:isoprenoid biosynthesis glyoxalase ElbB [Thermonemataceae bacterium]
MEKKLRFAVLLSGSGVYDGAEIHESVLALLALNKLGIEAVCVAPNVTQYHTINHLTGEVMEEQRNVLVESARIARGLIQDTAHFDTNTVDALLMPGGFGVAKNFTHWAFEGAQTSILPEIKELIIAFHKAKKPIGAVCMAPTTIAKALEGIANIQLSVGNTIEKSPYDIKSISEGINETGNIAVMVGVEDISIDSTHKVVCSPCYMMEANISQIYQGIEKTIKQMLHFIS